MELNWIIHFKKCSRLRVKDKSILTVSFIIPILREVLIQNLKFIKVDEFSHITPRSVWNCSVFVENMQFDLMLLQEIFCLFVLFCDWMFSQYNAAKLWITAHYLCMDFHTCMWSFKENVVFIIKAKQYEWLSDFFYSLEKMGI